MKIDKIKDLSFTEFYLIEFFKNTLDKGAGSIPEDSYNTLEELSNHLLAEDNVIDGLEKLARYQGTSEFAIFLFDMVDRIQDLSPYTVFSNVSDLAEDFINLYQLMVEDSDSISALESALDLFRKTGKASGKQISKKAGEDIAEKLLSFDDFYRMELDRVYARALETSGLMDKRLPYSELIEIFREFNHEVNDNELENYDPTVSRLARSVQALDIERDVPDVVIQSLDSNVKECVDALRNLERKEQDLFLQITTTKTIPKKKSKKPELFEEKVQKTGKEKVKTSVPSEIPAKDQTIDDVLHEYFKSEINVHLGQIKIYLEDNKSKASFTYHNKINEELQALKEISMIHGYSGIEHFCTSLISVFKRAKDEKRYIGEASNQVLDSIFDEMLKIENYRSGSSMPEEEQRERIETLSQNLNDSLTRTKPKDEEKEIIVEQPEIETEPEIAGGKTGEELIAFSDKDKIYPIIAEVFTKVHNSFKGRLQLDSVHDAINQLIGATSIVIPALVEEVGRPLLQAYTRRDNLKNEEKKECGNLIDNVWNEVINQINTFRDFSVLIPIFESINQIGTEESFSLEDDLNIAQAIVESEKGKWKKIKSELHNALLDENADKKNIFKNYFSNFITNCKVTAYTKYIPILEFYKQVFLTKSQFQMTAEIVDELDKSMDLVFERIESKGKSGSCDDILAVIQDITSVSSAETDITSEEQITKPESAKIIEPEAAVEQEKAEDDAALESTAQDEGEEDVESIFVSECQQYLNDAKTALKGLQKKPDDRDRFEEIETAMHGIRSSAHLLNKSSIGDAAAIIEEAAEIFGQSSVTVPDDLTEKLSTGLDDLEMLIEDAEKDISVSMEGIKEILDNVVIEDVTEDEPEVEAKPEKHDTSDLQEKPLFSDDEADEDMLEIFQDEAKEFITLIKDSNAILRDKPTNAKALDQLDYAAHSLKQAAKMLGFREIGQISDSLEELTDAIKNKKITNSSYIQDSVGEAVEIIEKLSAGETVKTAELSKAINALSIKHDEITEPKGIETEVGTEQPEEESRVNLAEIFIGEANELLDKMNADMLELEKMPESEPLLTNFLRNLHTLKGSAMMARFENIGELAHKLEDYFEVYKQQNTEIKQQMLNPVFSAMDLISEVLDVRKSGKDEKTIHFTSKLAEIDNKLFLFQNFDLGADSKIKSSSKSTSKSSAKVVKDDENVIRISTSYLDKLVNMATELLVNRTELISYYEDLKKIVSDVEVGKKQMYQAENLLEDVVEKDAFEDENSESSNKDASLSMDADAKESGWQNVSLNFKEISRKINTVNSQLNKLSQGFEKNINRIANLSKELHSDILKARMVPIEQLFNRYPRLVRDMAHDQHKQIELVIEDNEAELDRALVESLTDPILHIIRNAVDHGIESPKEREASNKDKKGTIWLRASQDKNQIVIDIINDGQGIDLEKVKSKVIKNKITTRKAIDKLSEAEILDFIFLPEFSTREKTSEVSGRGLGLNVVYNQIQKLKGIIRVKTEENAGTTFSIRVPLTLVVAQALMVKVQNQNIAIPVIAVQESSQFEMNEVLIDDDRKYLKVRGKLLPFVSINELLKFEGSKNKDEVLKSALVIHDAGVSMALGVGEIKGRQEIVIKALGDHLQNVEYIAGGTILGNGEVALILDYASVVRLVESQFFGRISDKTATRSPQKIIEEKTEEIEQVKATAAPAVPAKRQIKKKQISNRKPKVLIVDDSISVRNFVSSVLEKKGFSTYKSSDGASAIKRIEKGDVDIMITDLEMPKMTGFQLIENVRENKKYDDLPIVILSGKTGKDYRNKAMDIGANAFIMKPFKENDLLNVLGEFIEINQ